MEGNPVNLAHANVETIPKSPADAVSLLFSRITPTQESFSLSRIVSTKSLSFFRIMLAMRPFTFARVC